MIIKNLLILGSIFSLALATTSLAQQPEKSSVYKFDVTHNHRMGSCKGELHLTNQRVEYRSADKKSKLTHCRILQYEDIKSFDISQNKIKIYIYQKNKSLFSKVPTIGNSYEQYDFSLLKEEVEPNLLNFLIANFYRPISTSVIPNDTSQFGNLIYETSVFHQYKSKGINGILLFYEHSVVFQAEDTDQSRYWRYTDIRNIGRLGDYQLEISAYDASDNSTNNKNYLFDLKKIISTSEYDLIWIKLYKRNAVQ